MRKIIKYTFLLTLLIGALDAAAQRKTITGVVVDAETCAPLQSALISSPDLYRSAVSDEKGNFKVETTNEFTLLTVAKEGYFQSKTELLKRDSLVVYLQSESSSFFTDRHSTPDGEELMKYKTGSAQAVDIKDISEGYFSASDALTGRFAGLQVTNKSGMVGEGSFVNLQGIRSLLGQNTPLLVIDGVPYLPDQQVSNTIRGYSADILEPVNLKIVERVTLLRGADAMIYGSLGSNGVLLIDTEKGLVSRTLVEFQSVAGMSFIDNRIPLLRGQDYSLYMSDLASSRYLNSQQIGEALPFLSGNMTHGESVKYGFDTDWQKEIFTPGLMTDNSLKVRGGDAVVQYLITVGYQNIDGVVEGTSKSKFFTTGKTNINFSNKLKAFALVSFDFIEMKLQEQGMTPQTNPLLAAYSSSPLTGIKEVDANGVILNEYAKVHPVIQVSNPAAILTGVEAKNKSYDILVNSGATYNFKRNLQANVTFGIFYNYLKDDIFIGGMSDNAIVPLMDGLAKNTVGSGASEALDYYGKVNLNYKLTRPKHELNTTGGWQIMTSKFQASSGYGINTSSDRYRTLSNVSDVGRSSGGYSDLHNWMNFYLTADYNYNHILFASATGVVDASSTYGDHSARWFVFPGVKGGVKINNLPFLMDSWFVSNLMLRGEYSVNPNSRFSSTYGDFYYKLQFLRNVSGLVRAGVPNRYIGPEKVHNLNLGVDFTARGERITASADLYVENVRDVITDNQISPLYDMGGIHKNNGHIRTVGGNFSLSGLLANGGFRWRVGGNASIYRSKIISLGGEQRRVITLDDGVVLVNEVGRAPFSYYGHRAEGVYATSGEANAAGLSLKSGYQFAAGDVRFKDNDGDHVISDADREILSRNRPIISGGLFSKMNWKGFSLFANFSYMAGNTLYNGTRRYNESGDSFSNQAASMSRRWMTEGQQTDIPKVIYGDPAGNNRFSSRWVEDGSYVKLKEVTLAWETRRQTKLYHGLKVFVTAENIWCLTDYKGSDPEFAYAYDTQLIGMDLAKIPLPKTIKAGIVVSF